MSRSKSADKPSVEFIEKLYATQVQQKNLTPATQPNVVFVTGVAGSGKSFNTTEVKKNPAFNVFSIHPDDYRKLHPKINHLIEKHGRDNAHEHTGSFSNRTALALRDKAIEDRLNVVYEATFGNIETAKNLINSFADNGYRVTVIALPVNLELSIERNESRYQAKKEDIHTLPRKVSKEDIQKMADNFMNNLNELENNGVIVYRVSHHHEAMQAVNDTVISMQKLDEMALDAPLSAVQAKHIANQTLATFPALNTLDSRLVLHRFLDKLNQSNQHTNIQSIQNSIINMQEKLPAIMEQSRQILDKSKDKGGRER
ncbi:MAG: zeta toxin family protein [Neisseriaceae bacterium]|nr:zeta toxin family protein [Neisseriaceae bacterium]MBQ9619969.1 zeta toxin family protein [Neisseriaceae bacterium]MBR0129396.1 zeta toxin family protein [Neisseriaceae bacterium]